MKDYLCVLGRDSELSVIELVAYLQKNEISYSIKEISNPVAIFSVDEKFRSRRAVKNLGGIVKIGEILKNLDNAYVLDELHDTLVSELYNELVKEGELKKL